MPLFALLMLWNSMTAHSARNQWFAAVVALFFGGVGGWFVRKVWEGKQRENDRRSSDANPRGSADSFAG